MLRSIREIIGYSLRALDADIGRLKDLLFDDRQWVVRYMAADTGKWLPGRRVLLAPAQIGTPDWASRVLPVNLKREQIENAPSIQEHLPVSRQHEAELSMYYGWAPYWGPVGAPIGSTAPVPHSREHDKGIRDPNLRSVQEVTGYHIECSDNSVGHAEDFIAETQGWRIRYMVVDTRNWLPGRKVIISPEWIEDVDWAQRRILVKLSCRQLRQSPVYDPSQPVNREYESMLYDYYGRPRYWDGE